MVVFKKYWKDVGSILKEKLGPLYEKRERLREICVPYKIQRCETPYYCRADIIDSVKELAGVEERVGDILNK